MYKHPSFNDIKHSIEQIKINTVGFELIYFMDSYNRVVYEDIVAFENSPKFKTASMDGYAIKYNEQNYKKLKISGINPAGNSKIETIADGCCIKTFTGSIMPNGSDTLIPIENVTVHDDFIEINTLVSKGYAVREVGENYKKDEILIKKGTTISFAEIGVMASLNLTNIKVSKKPTISILATGSELLMVGEESSHDGQIRNTNSYTLEILARKYGANVIQLGVLKDNKDEIFETIKKAIDFSDIIVTTGGVSVGDFDFVKDIIHELNADIIIPSVNIKPGQHVKIAKYKEKFLALLPGFAYSSTVTFYLFVKPIIEKMLNKESIHKQITAKFSGNYLKKSNKSEFIAVDLEFKENCYHVNINNKKSGSSAILTNLLGNVALMYIDENTYEIQDGDFVTVYLF